MSAQAIDLRPSSNSGFQSAQSSYDQSLIPPVLTAYCSGFRSATYRLVSPKQRKILIHLRFELNISVLLKRGNSRLFLESH